MLSVEYQTNKKFIGEPVSLTKPNELGSHVDLNLKGNM